MEWRPTHEVETAIHFAAETFMSEMLLKYPHIFWLEAIAGELVATFEVYVESSLETPLIARQLVSDMGLVLLLAKIYELTVCQKRNCCCSDCQLAKRCLIGKVLHIVRCI